MALAAERVTVATTATLIRTADADGESDDIRNRGASSVFLGGSDVTTATGFELLPDETFSIALMASEKVYGIVAAGTAEVHVIGNRR